MKYLKYIFISLLTGITSIVPGLSGGTIFAIFNISEDLVSAIKKVSTLRIENIKKYFALPLIIGMGSLLSSIIYAKLFVNIIDEWKYFLIFLFIGLILFSTPILLNQAKNNDKLERKSLIIFTVGIIITLAILSVSPSSTVTTNPYSPLYLIKYTFISIINGMTMIIPGISGTNVLLIFGEYNNYINFTSNFTQYFLQNILFIISVMIGSILSSYILSYIFKRFRVRFFALIAGMNFAIIFYLLFLMFTQDIFKQTSILIIFTQSILGFILGYSIIKLSNR